MPTKVKTRWFPRSIEPVRNGRYECAVVLCSIQKKPLVLPRHLVWDGKGFLVPFGMRVTHWRGMTASAHRQAISKKGVK